MRLLFCLISLLLLVSCKSSSLSPISSGSDPTWTGTEESQVLVAMLFYTPQMRVQFEDEVAAALQKEGINAVPSYPVLPNLPSLNGEVFVKLLSGNPGNAVYFAKSNNVSKQQTNNQTDGDSLFTSLLRGGEWDTTFIATMESALYVHGQTDAVWWNRVRLEANEKNVQTAMKKYVRNEIQMMKEAGAISRLK